MASTKDVVRGPWVERVILRDNNGSSASGWHCVENNPTAHVNATTGEVVVVFRANYCTSQGGKQQGGEQLGVAIAPHWSAEFVRSLTPIVPYKGRGTPDNEDPFVWADDSGWHIINHQQSTGNVCGGPDAGHSCGVHWCARQPTGPWRQSSIPACVSHSSFFPLFVTLHLCRLLVFAHIAYLRICAQSETHRMNITEHSSL
jgi:hypothetical protein